MLRCFLLAVVCPPLPLALMRKWVQAAVNAMLWLTALYLFYRRGWSFWPFVLLDLAIVHPVMVYQEMRLSTRVAFARRMYEKHGMLIHPK